MRGRFSQIVAPSEARNRSFALCFFFRCRQTSNHAAPTTTHQSARTLPSSNIPLPCPVLPSHHAFFLRNPGRLGPVSRGQQISHMWDLGVTFEVTFYRVQCAMSACSAPRPRRVFQAQNLLRPCFCLLQAPLGRAAAI
jgi:hypothetical protein